jgi:hypothetical protein
MNQVSPLNIERQAARVLEELLREIPALKLNRIERQTAAQDSGIDILADTNLHGKRVRFVVEVKNNGQPRVMRDAARQLKAYTASQKIASVPIVMAPYLSDQAREVCNQEGVGYADLEGNTHIAFDTLYIDRQVAGRPEPERRQLRSLFKPKSARLLRCLFRDPNQPWRRLIDLAQAAQISLGQASNIASALRERGWLEQTDHGLILVDPNDLLDRWAEEYEPPKGEAVKLYTHLHGKSLTTKLMDLRQNEGLIVLSSFSAAEWLAPYVRQPNASFYADEQGLDVLERHFDLKPVERGSNVTILIPDEDGVLADAEPVAPGLLATSPVQTYLDLWHSGERGREGAQHLRDKLMKWQ